MAEFFNTTKQIRPRCPHCGHQLCKEEMDYGQPTCADNLHDLAPLEGLSVIQCPSCDLQYAVKGGYTPHYTTSFCLDDFSYGVLDESS